MKYAALFFALSILLFFIGLTRQSLYLVLCWPAISFFVVAIGYSGFGPAVYGKRCNGTLHPLLCILHLPFLLYAWGIWHLSKLLAREEPFNDLGDDIIIGRRLVQRELPDDVASVVDLTCEFIEPKSVREHAAYISRPILDATAPSARAIVSIVNEVSNLPRPVYIHCAQGHGRTGTIAAALLLHSKKATSTAHAIRLLQEKRPRARLNTVQQRALDTFSVMVDSLENSA